MAVLQKFIWLIIPVLVMAAISGCTATTPTASEDAINTMVAATFQEMTLQAQSAPLATHTPLIPTANLPTPTSTILTAPAAVRLSFATGATFGITQGTLQPGQSQTYVLNAMQGQPVIAMVDSYNHDVTIGITGKNGVVLLDASQAQTTWQGLLPSTQDYFIKIKSGPSAENYTLSVQIASRIQFATGATSATRTGSTVGGYNVTYVLHASAGQIMNINLTVPSGAAALTVWGFTDGQPYLRAQIGATIFSKVLPSTQDYIVEIAPQGGQVVSYSMTVEVK